jgi:uncharacterized membrane protein YfcA
MRDFFKSKNVFLRAYIFIRTSVLRLVFRLNIEKKPPPLKWEDNLPRLMISSVVFIIILFLILFLLSQSNQIDTDPINSVSITIVLLSALFQVIDSSVGMGFGTAMVPLLLALGYDPLSIVPTLLIVQAISGLMAGWLHHEVGNLNLSFQPLNNSAKALIVTVCIGVVSSMLSIVLVYFTWSIPEKIIKTYISILVIVSGLIVIVSKKERWRQTYRQNRLLFFALLAGINKGISSSGYGPLITLGTIYAGIRVKSAVALTTLAEGLVSLFGCLTFLFLMSMGLELNLELLPFILIGSFLASVAAPYIVRVFPSNLYKSFVPTYAILIGVFLLCKTYLG